MHENERELVLQRLGGRIREQRVCRDMMQSELGEKAGMGRTTVVNIEMGRSFPSAYGLFRIARALCCSVDYLLGTGIYDAGVAVPPVSVRKAPKNCA